MVTLKLPDMPASVERLAICNDRPNLKLNLEHARRSEHRYYKAPRIMCTMVLEEHVEKAQSRGE